MPRRPPLPSPDTAIVVGVRPERKSPARVASHFRRLLAEGARPCPAGRGRSAPGQLVERYEPRFELRLFDATYLLTGYRHDEALGFFVAWIGLERRGAIRRLYPRILYKDSSLVWRVASHFVHDHEEYWMGKGDVRVVRRGGYEYVESAEETANLPYEIQDALDDLSRRGRKVRDDEAIELIVREAPQGRVAPYADFTRPRRRAAEGQELHGGRPIARFLRKGDPGSLRFARGFEPDLREGVLEEARSASRFFGGELRKFRVLSTNRLVQFQFVASPTHVWVNPPQTLTTELSTFGVRVHDVLAPEDAFLPGYEYHEPADENGDVSHTQIPAGYAGAPHPDDPARADASAWIEELPLVREFRSRVLGGRRKARGAARRYSDSSA